MTEEEKSAAIPGFEEEFVQIVRPSSFIVSQSYSSTSPRYWGSGFRCGRN